MSENEMIQDDEISLFDLWEKLRKGWKAVVGGVALGIGGALLAIALIPPRYEALAVVQVGLLGQVGQFKISGQPVEPPIQAGAVARLLAQWKRVPYALWIQDLALEAAMSVGMMHASPALRFGQWLESWSHARAKKMFLIADGFRENLESKGEMSDRLGIACHFDPATRTVADGAGKKIEPITYGTLKPS